MQKVIVGVAVLVVALVAAWQAGWIEPGAGEGRGAGGEAGGALLDGTRAGRDVKPAGPVLEGLEAAPKPLTPPAPPITGPRVTGRVVDVAGRGLAGARVLAIPDTSGTLLRLEELGTPGCPAPSVTADGEGRFVVPVSKDAPFHLLLADAPGFGLGGEADVAPGAEVTLRLEPTRALTGVVKDREGKGVAGAKVRALLLIDTIRMELEGTSGADGAYRVDGLPPERRPKPGAWIGWMDAAWIEVTAEGFAPLTVEQTGWKDADLKRDLTLSRGAILVGRVEDAESGAPLGGATVALHSVEGMRGYSKQSGARFGNPYAPRPLSTTTTGEDGSFRLEHLPCEGPHPTASNNGMGNGKRALGGVVAWRAGHGAAGESVEVAADGATIEVTLRLWPGAIVTGHLVEKDGSPVVGAQVGAQVEGRASKGYVPPFVGAPAAWAKSGADGRFRIEALPASNKGPTEAKLVVYRAQVGRRYRQGDDGTLAVSVRAGETVDVGDFVLAAPEEGVSTTTVVVTRPDGTPYFGATVDRGQMLEAPRTDAQGRATWTWGKPQGGKPIPPLDVIVRARGFAPTPATLQPPGAGQDTVTVVLHVAHRLAGRVLAADGRPLALQAVAVGDGAAKVDEVFPDNQGGFAVYQERLPRGRKMPLIYGQTMTREDGTFEVEGLPEGPYHVRAAKPRRVALGPNAKPLVALVSGVPSDADDVRLQLPPDDSPPVGALVGRVREAGTGDAVADVWILVKRDGVVVASAYPPLKPGQGRVGAVAPGTVDESGAFRIDDVPVGTLAIEVGAPGFRVLAVAPVELSEGAPLQVGDLALDRGVAVVGRIRGPLAAAAKGRNLTFREIGGRAEPRHPMGLVQPDGSFRVTGFEPGRYRPVLQQKDWFAADQAPLIPATGEDLVIAAGATEVVYDVEWAAAGMIGLQPNDERLPPAPWNGGAASAEQTRFGAGTRVTVKGASGQVLLDVKGVQRMYVPPESWQVLLPGRYVARIEFPDGEAREETLEVKAGARLDVWFKRP